MRIPFLTTTASWNEVAQKVLDVQAQWKQIGYAPQKQNTKIYERFRTACGAFFDKKNTFYKDLKDSLNDNLNKKLILCEKAADFTEEEWYTTLKKTLKMEELVTKHSTIMDKYDPEKIIGLMVDEWGCWYEVEEGTNPGFLYQQNTMRDALVAGINLNIFNKHCDRVKMANITVEEGDIFGFIGHNGAGKSTTIRAVVGICA